MTNRRANPFFFETPSSRWDFTDRTREMKELGTLLSGTGRRVLIHGRRRMGKTSILEEVARRKGSRLIMVDVSTAASLSELAKKLLAAAPDQPAVKFQQVMRLAQKFFKSVTFEAGKISLGGEFRPLDDGATLEGALNFLHECSAFDDGNWTVVFDEFQELERLASKGVDWMLRGVIQQHRNINYVFTGSDHRIVKWMTQPSAPFFKQLQQFEIGPIDPAHLAGWIRERAKIGGMSRFPYAEQIVQTAGPCTGDIVRLAKTVFDFADAGQEGDVVSAAFDAIALVEMNAEFNAKWTDVSSTVGRSMLRAIAKGLPHTSADTLRRYGIRSTSSAGTAVTTLIERQILTRDADSRPIFDSPFFKRWVGFNAAG